jgi:hypothetical protein
LREYYSVAVERCTECGFGSEAWSDEAAMEEIGRLPDRWLEAVAGIDAADLQRRPFPDMWSIAEYVDHVREVLFGMRFVLDSSLCRPGVDLGDPPTPGFAATPRLIDVRAALNGLDTEATTLHDGLVRLGATSWTSTAIIGDSEVDAHWICRHAVHDATHHLGDVSRLRQALP